MFAANLNYAEPSSVEVIAASIERRDYLKSVSEIKISLPFENSGECSDEVVLSFDDGQKLYVSENFLGYASPVFKAMFTHDCKEKETKEVAMKEKVFDDFQEFLLCLHPGVQKPIDNDNVLRVVSFAEEYQVDVSVKRCQSVMKSWLSSEVESALKIKDDFKKAKNARTCLNILIKAQACGFEELVTDAIQVVARFGHKVFTGSAKVSQLLTLLPAQGFGRLSQAQAYTENQHVRVPQCLAAEFGVNQTQEIRSPFGTETVTAVDLVQSNKSQHGGSNLSKPVCPVEECKILYESLPEELKTRLLLQRLKLCDDGKMR